MAKGAIINTVSRDLEKYKKDTIKRVKDLVSFHGSALQYRAQRGLDAAIASFIGQGIDIRHISLAMEVKDGGLTFLVGVSGYVDESRDIPIDEPMRMAVYIEFGTGLSAKDILSNYPNVIVDIARKYFVTGEGTLVGQPYLFNNQIIVKGEFDKDLEALLKKEYKS